MATNVPTDELATWFERRLPAGWFTGLEVLADAEEILLIGTLPEPPADDDETPALRAARLDGHVAAFREATRGERIAVAQQAESRFRRRVAWGVRCGDVRRLFTTNSTPVMTRLRLPERQVIDTLVDAGVARSRSEALAWCVQRVADVEDEWLGQLRDAFAHVEAVRVAGPGRA